MAPIPNSHLAKDPEVSSTRGFYIKAVSGGDLCGIEKSSFPKFISFKVAVMAAEEPSDPFNTAS